MHEVLLKNKHNTIFSLEALHREIDRLEENKAIGEDRASPRMMENY